MRYLKFVLVTGVIVMLLSGAALAQVSITPSPQPFSIDGVIAGVDLNAGSVILGPSNPYVDRATMIFFVSEKTQIMKDGNVVRLAGLAVGDICKAVVINRSDGMLLALSVSAKSPAPPPAYARGRIDKIDLANSVFTLKLDNTMGIVPITMLFSADAVTRIIKDGKPASFADLRAGDVASVGYIPTQVLAINVPIHAVTIEAKTAPEMVGYVYGRLSAIDPANNVISVTPMNTINSRAVVLRFRVTNITNLDKFGPAPFDALRVGDVVNLLYVKAADSLISPALSITVFPNTFQGFIAGVDVNNGTVLLQVSPMGPTVMFKVVNKTLYFKNGIPATIKDVMQKDSALVKFFCFKDGNVASVIYLKSPIRITPVLPK